MDMLQGKHFSITDPKGVNTVIYQINKTEKEFLKEIGKTCLIILKIFCRKYATSTKKSAE